MQNNVVFCLTETRIDDVKHVTQMIDKHCRVNQMALSSHTLVLEEEETVLCSVRRSWAVVFRQHQDCLASVAHVIRTAMKKSIVF